jgi:sigma-B regulation protein RsbU (phosphoserine phosphatase)
MNTRPRMLRSLGIAFLAAFSGLTPCSALTLLSPHASPGQEIKINPACSVGLLQEDDDARLKAILENDFDELFIGVLLTSLGLFAATFFFLRQKEGTSPIFFFGLFAFLYGVRLFAHTSAIPVFFGRWALFFSYLEIFIIYFIPVPLLLFLMEILERKWRPYLRLMLWISVAVAGGAVVLDSLSQSPGLFRIPYNILIIVFICLIIFALVLDLRRPSRLLAGRKELKILIGGFLAWAVLMLNENLENLHLVPWGFRIEHFGFFILVCCLGYVSAYRFFVNEKNLATIAHEMEMAHQIQMSILPSTMPGLPGLAIRAQYVPMASVGGDFYDFVVLDKRRLGLFIADVSGHGIPAALIASMLKVALSSQKSRASQPELVLSGINQIFCGELQEEFVTASYAFLDLEKRTIRFSGAGHPYPYLWRGSRKELTTLEKNGLPLGQFPDEEYETGEMELRPGDRLFFYTDGIVEARNSDGELFGYDRLAAYIKESGPLPADQFIQTFLERLTHWSKKKEQADDLTLIVADFLPVL